MPSKHVILNWDLFWKTFVIVHNSFLRRHSSPFRYDNRKVQRQFRKSTASEHVTVKMFSWISEFMKNSKSRENTRQHFENVIVPITGSDSKAAQGKTLKSNHIIESLSTRRDWAGLLDHRPNAVFFKLRGNIQDIIEKALWCFMIGTELIHPFCPNTYNKQI